MARPALDRARLAPAVRGFHRKGVPARLIAFRLGISERSTRGMLKDLGLTMSRAATPREMELRHG
ncbi:hypothetical protein [Asaia astilbis]|uniref:hypothetical protein n=1 Tax=Asaia astilbis TaxID=610244 RepID=UPI00046EAE78|nr:hypothetical protein [Asaia astilbis]